MKQKNSFDFLLKSVLGLVLTVYSMFAAAGSWQLSPSTHSIHGTYTWDLDEYYPATGWGGTTYCALSPTAWYGWQTATDQNGTNIWPNLANQITTIPLGNGRCGYHFDLINLHAGTYKFRTIKSQTYWPYQATTVDWADTTVPPI